MANLNQIADDLGFTEGPVFRSEGDVVVTSIDRGHVYAIAADGSSERLANTGGGPNGATEGLGGVIYVAQNGARGPWHRRPTLSGGVQALSPDGSLRWVTMDPISPNDLCFGPDGYLYVTDPTRRPARDDGRLWRVDVQSGHAELLASLPWYPNGIGFGTDPEILYVASSGDGRMVRFRLDGDRLSGEETAFTIAQGHGDGFAFDTEGNVIVGAVGAIEGEIGQIQVWSASGTLEEVIEPGTSRYYTNVALSADRRLLITDSDSGAVLADDGWPTAGLPLFPFRSA